MKMFPRRKREVLLLLTLFYILKQLYIFVSILLYFLKSISSLKSGLPQLSEEEKKSDEKRPNIIFLLF